MQVLSGTNLKISVKFLDKQVKKEHCNRFKFLNLKTLDFISYTFSDVLFGQFVDRVAILKK